MLSVRRVIVATVIGIVLAGIMFAVTRILSDLSLTEAAIILAGPVLIGFICGISALRMPWWLHGIILGVIAGTPTSLTIASLKPWNYTRWEHLLLSFLLMAICGFIIELWTTAVFRMKHLPR